MASWVAFGSSRVGLGELLLVFGGDQGLENRGNVKKRIPAAHTDLGGVSGEAVFFSQ